MKRIIIICEGPTEKEFCKDVLQSYFLERNISIQCPLVKKSGGGIVPWMNLKSQIENHLRQDRNSYVTTFIDYYGIPESFQFPNWVKAHQISDKNRRMEVLEKGMLQSIDSKLNFRFLPYLQLHEFESLLFIDVDTFVGQIPEDEFTDKDELIQTIKDNPNPELINDTPNNAPSHRLGRLIKGYNKIVYGSILAETIGLNRIMDKCPRFSNWINKIENL